MPMELVFFIEVLAGGLLAGVMYALVALGFVLIYKASGVFNFAQGAMVFFAALTYVSLVERGWNFWLALAVTLAVMVALGVATERIVLRPLVNQPQITLFMATIGLTFVLEGLSQLIWGSQPHGLELGIADVPMEWLSQKWNINISQFDLFAAFVAGLLVAVLAIFFQKTRIGRALRAVADDHQAALAVGIPLQHIWAIVWAVAGFVALVAGLLVLVAACGAGDDAPVLTVNGWTLSRGAFRDQLQQIADNEGYVAARSANGEPFEVLKPGTDEFAPELVAEFLNERITFELARAEVAARGLTVTDEMRVTIAAQACLLILNRRTDYYFPELTQVLVYPGAFVVEREEYDEAGVRSRERQVLVGESWTDSQVLLSWEDVLEGAAVEDDGWNVVLHEFAHQLDQAKGYASGAPELPGAERYAAWSEVFSAEFERLRERGEDPASLLDEYGATDPAEFFAVVTEVFFEQPLALQAEHPALYRELARFYRVDPATWPPPSHWNP